MLTLIDRQLIVSYVKAYVICLVSMMGLFIVVDLFTNLDIFTEGKTGFQQVVDHILIHYGMKSMQIFDRLCEAIVLLAAMFTVALLQRNNELLPLLSAGISTRRVVRPVLLSAFLMLGLAILNQELVLPRIDSYLVESKDYKGEKGTEVQGGYETNGIIILGKSAVKKDMTVQGFACVFPPNLGRDNLTALQAKEARYVPSHDNKEQGWLLTDTLPLDVPNWRNPDLLEMIAPGKYFLHTKDIDFDTMIRPKVWYMYCSTLNLLGELAKAHTTQVAGVAVVFHMRLARPILGMLLVFMGLSIILRDQNRNVFISTGLCLLLCAIFFMSVFFCKHLGDNEFISPALAAWFPVVVFGPLSFVMFDAVHT
jgi:lipopolysaccharide export system permease protein